MLVSRPSSVHTALLSWGLRLVVRKAEALGLMNPCNAIHCGRLTALAPAKPWNGFRPWLGKVSHCPMLARTRHACTYPHHSIFDHCMVSAGGCVPDFRDKRPEQNKSVFCSCLYCYSFLQKRRNNNSFGCLMLLSVKGLLEQHAAWLYPKD